MYPITWCIIAAVGGFLAARGHLYAPIILLALGVLAEIVGYCVRRINRDAAAVMDDTRVHDPR